VRIVIADDEVPARRRLARLLAQAEGVELVGEAATGREALREAERTRPDAILLDIEMPDLRGLDVASRIDPGVAVVFVTAHEEHAVDAFDLAAVDYLLKPVRLERLIEALRRVRVRAAARAGAPPAVAGGAMPDDDAARIVASTRGVTRFFDARSIVRFWSADKYTAFEADGEEQLVEEPLSALEQRLAPLGFVRVHRAHLVRRAAIRELRALDRPEIELTDGAAVPVSRRLLGGLRAVLRG
jgi:DNA-binding LytR/AlgR family response regulator